MLLVLSISHQNLESMSQRTLRGVLILLTYKKLYYGALAESDVIFDVYILLKSKLSKQQTYVCYVGNSKK